MTTTTERLEDLEYFFACAAEQVAEDERLAAEHFTGAAPDLTTGDYGAWLQGVRLGWAATRAKASARVREQVARDAKQEVAAH